SGDAAVSGPAGARPGPHALLPSPLVLASRSPQRRAILEQLGVPFEVCPAEVEELAEGDPYAVALENARRKRAAVDGEHVLAVDTLVTLDGAIHGKPAGAAEARATLAALSGRTHRVVSGLVLDDHATIAVTAVAFRELDD